VGGVLALLNGVPSDAIGMTDRGLMYGDGLFATMVLSEGRVLNLGLHLDKLAAGALRLSIPWPGHEVFMADIDQLASGSSHAGKTVLKLMLTRGSGGRGYAPPVDACVTRIVLQYPFPLYPEYFQSRGVRLRLCSMRLGRNPLLAGIKHLNRLEQVLARMEWSAPDIQEGLLCDTEGLVIEGTMSNVFIVSPAGVLQTPLLSQCGVSGVQRTCVMQLAAGCAGLAVQESQLSVDDVMAASEVFLTNSVIGLWPVRQFEDRHWSAPGMVTQRLLNLLQTAERDT
jgi:4-amino-4-deoxychorismate lyase